MEPADFSSFQKPVELLLELPSARAKALRRAIGKAIYEKISFPKGVLQQKQSQFVLAAIEITGIKWQSKLPYKLISNLKNSGNGDLIASVALLFLCCKINEFDDVRSILSKAAYQAGGRDFNRVLPLVEFHLSDILSAPELMKFSFHRSKFETGRIPIQQDLDAFIPRQAAKRHPSSDRSNPVRSAGAGDDGRFFLENALYRYLSPKTKTGVSMLSIIDVDGITKINLLYGQDVGDLVLSTLKDTVAEVVTGLDCKFDRCGGDAFYVALCGEGAKKMLSLMELVRSRMHKYPWESHAGGLWVTVSIGVAKAKPQETSIAFAIRAAAGMKAAKERGGNAVITGPQYLAHTETFQPGSTRRSWS